MEINGIDESAYSAHLLRDYKITALPVESEYWQGRNRSSFNLLTQKYGLKKLTLPVAFDGANRERVTMTKSRFDAALWGKVEIYLPNGFFYTCILDSAGELEYDGEEHGRASYELIGMQHKARVTVKSSTFSCSSTVPHNAASKRDFVSVTFSRFVPSNATGSDSFFSPYFCVRRLNEDRLRPCQYSDSTGKAVIL